MAQLRGKIRTAARRRLCVAALLMLAPAPLAAQYGAPPPRPPEIPANQPAPAAPPTAASQAVVLRAAACLVGSDAEAGPALLATPPYSSAERDQALRAIRGGQRCLRQREAIATSALVMRGAVAETLYETAFAAPPPPRDPAASVASWFNPAAATTREDAASLAPTYTLAACSAAARPDLVRALLAAEPATDAEAAALQALNPVFVGCVTPGTTLNVDRAGIRALLAESIYRWSVVQRDGPTSSWAAPAVAAAPAAPGS